MHYRFILLLVALVVAGIVISSQPPAHAQAATVWPPETSSRAVLSTSQALPTHQSEAPSDVSESVSVTANGVVLQLSGTGTQNTPTFTVPTTWQVSYSYNCANFGLECNGSIWVHNPDGSIPIGDDTPIMWYGMSGAGAQVYTLAGTYYLSISTFGTWSITVSSGTQMTGDVNGDRVVNAVDALCELRYIAHLAVTSACPNTPAGPADPIWDVNVDGTITAVDALCILRHVAQLPATSTCPTFG